MIKVNDRPAFEGVTTIAKRLGHPVGKRNRVALGLYVADRCYTLQTTQKAICKGYKLGRLVRYPSDSEEVEAAINGFFSLWEAMQRPKA